MKNLLNKKESNQKRIMVIMSAALIVCMVFVSIAGNNISSADTKLKKDVKNTEKEIAKVYPDVLKSNGNSKDKVETTYVIMDADGKNQDVIVTEKLSNNKNEKELNDFSSLENIENTSGNEKFTKNGNNISWKADGNKIEYKGNTKEELPVKVKVSYYLNGEEKSAKQIAGKSGNVKIRFDYEVINKNSIDGKIYDHPYTMMSGLVLKNEDFSDVNVTNGKAIDDGSKTVALGVAFPSMEKNLGINNLNLSIPSYVEVSAYTDNFNIMGTYSAAISGEFNDIDENYSGDIDSKINMLKDNLNKLSDSSKQILQGSEKLSEGGNKLNEGVSSLSIGANNIDQGFGEALSGAKALNEGLKNLSQNSKKINDGMSMLETSIFDDATNQIREKLKDNEISLTPETYIQVIQGISDNALKLSEKKLRDELKSKGITNLDLQNQILSVAYNILMTENKFEANNDDIREAIIEAGKIAKHAQYVKTAVEKNKEKAINVLVSKGYSKDDINEEIIAVTSTAIELANGNVDMIESKNSEAIEYVKDASTFVNGGINSVENVRKLASIAVGKETPKKLNDLKDNLDRFESLKAGIKEYTSGVDTIAAGSDKLLIGMIELNNGIEKLNDASSKLSSGSDNLKNGINKLKDSINKFDSEGISKFTESLSKSDIIKISNNIKGIKEASKKQVFIGGKLDSMSGESRIIFKTEEIN